MARLAYLAKPPTCPYPCLTPDPCPLGGRLRGRQLVKGHAGLLYAEHIEAKGVDLFQAICAKGLEGIVCKHRLASNVEAVTVPLFQT